MTDERLMPGTRVKLIRKDKDGKELHGKTTDFPRGKNKTLVPIQLDDGGALICSLNELIIEEQTFIPHTSIDTPSASALSSFNQPITFRQLFAQVPGPLPAALFFGVPYVCHLVVIGPSIDDLHSGRWLFRHRPSGHNIVTRFQG